MHRDARRDAVGLLKHVGKEFGTTAGQLEPASCCEYTRKQGPSDQNRCAGIESAVGSSQTATRVGMEATTVDGGDWTGLKHEPYINIILHVRTAAPGTVSTGRTDHDTATVGQQRIGRSARKHAVSGTAYEPELDAK